MKSEKCSNCGFEFPEAAQNETERSPCPACGCMARTISVSITEKIKVYEGLGYKVKDPSKTRKSKIKVEGFHKYARSQKAALVKHIRVIDRENDQYKELVINTETEEVIHSCEEPLSEHTGHGSDKKKTT